MKRSIMRVAIGVMGLGLLVTAGCKKPQVPPDMMARIEAAANKAEAAANKAEAAAKSASEAAMRADAAASKLESRYSGSMYK